MVGRSYKTDANGGVRLKGGADRLVEIFVYADGFEPRRATWHIGAPLVVDMAPRNATLTFSPSKDIIARVGDIASPHAAPRWVKRTSNGSASSISLKAGAYDVTTYGSRGDATRYARVSIAAAQLKSFAAAADQRPHVIVRFPNEGWHAIVSDAAPRGGAVGWVVMMSLGGSRVLLDESAILENETLTEAVFTLSRAGRMRVELRREGETLSLSKEFEIKPGESLTIQAPRHDSTLEGSMRTFNGGLVPAEHGWAGPRLQLIPDDPAGWSVTEYLPARDATDGDAKHRFTLHHLPVGSYHVYQHLIGKERRETVDGREYQYTLPMNAWGGIAVKLEPGGATRLKDFIDYPTADLRVRISDSKGRPVENATLRIRDRMSEASKQVEENPAQIEEAEDPLPYPPAVRVIHGLAKLPAIREGWLELVVELDNGPAYAFTRASAPRSRLGARIASWAVVGGAQSLLASSPALRWRPFGSLRCVPPAKRGQIPCLAYECGFGSQGKIFWKARPEASGRIDHKFVSNAEQADPKRRTKRPPLVSIAEHLKCRA